MLDLPLSSVLSLWKHRPMPSPQVSVLMPTWNAGQYVAEAVESILLQSLADFELLVVDGGSTDRTLEIVSRYRDERVRVLSAPSAGLAPALNFGMAQARAPWIARQDADDVSLPSVWRPNGRR